MTRYRIAVIPGDGIGKEVVPEGIHVLDAAGRRFGIKFAWDHFDWTCAGRHGRRFSKPCPAGRVQQMPVSITTALVLSP